MGENSVGGLGYGSQRETYEARNGEIPDREEKKGR